MEALLDPLFTRLSRTPLEHPLESFEHGVWARLDEASHWSPARSLRVRLAALGVALLAGAAVVPIFHSTTRERRRGCVGISRMGLMPGAP